MNELQSIGYNDWLHSHIDPEKTTHHDLARVISVHKDSYTITNGEGEVFAELTGNLYYSATSRADLPTTGDWVYANFYDDDTHAIIHGILPRKTVLQRKTSGKEVDFQLIAANLDVAFIMQSLDANLNLRRLERYLVMVNESNITPVILLSKCDLMPEDEVAEMRRQIANIAPGITIIAFSNLNGENMDAIENLLVPGQTYCLLGSSGVGKTTLLNSILGSEQFETRAVNKSHSKGRHTTTTRELVQLDNGALLIDTPGMRELGNMSVDSGLDETFSDVLELIQQCKFSNCSHTKEKGCAVLAAIENGELSEKRFRNYQKMIKESAFNEMSYHEKRQKQKDFGKMIKTTLKNKKRY